MNQAAVQYAEQAIYYIDKKERIKNYWAKRSHDFADLRLKELSSPLAGRWLDEICRYFPKEKNLRILDIGTGTGFFAFLLESMGHRVTGIDLTPSMIEEAKNIGRKLNSGAHFRVMDAEQLLYRDESFDVIITRNLTWTLPNPENAYAEWFRVLKKGGIMLNFDGNYGRENFAEDEDELPENHAHKSIGNDLMRECDRIKNQLEISYHVRPAWDVEIMEKAGFEKLELNLGVSRRIYQEVDEFYNPTPLFMIKATK